jgi:hypothetical protein
MYSPNFQFSIFRKNSEIEPVSREAGKDAVIAEPEKSTFSGDKSTPVSAIFARLSGLNSAQESCQYKV